MTNVKQYSSFLSFKNKRFYYPLIIYHSLTIFWSVSKSMRENIAWTKMFKEQ